MTKEPDEIYTAYAQKIYRFLCHLTHDSDLSEDLLQETFYRAVKDADSFRGDSRIETWLFQIAKNCWFDYLRKNKIQFENIDLYVEFIPAEGESTEKHLIQSITKEKIMAICRKMGTKGDVFLLHTVQELDYDEVGTLYNRSSAWARVTCFRARDYIRKELENEGYFL